MSKNLVAYFSASGTTKEVAEVLANAASADLFEIKPAKPYTREDLNWTNKNSRSYIEMNNPKSRPEIASKVENIEDYNTIFVGFPVWWYVAPTIINTFLESYDFSGKTIVLFATSGGSGLGRSGEVLQKCVDKSTKIVSGKVLNGRATEKSLKSWIDSLNI